MLPNSVSRFGVSSTRSAVHLSRFGPFRIKKRLESKSEEIEFHLRRKDILYGIYNCFSNYFRSKDDLVEVLVASKEKKIVEGKAKTKKPNKVALPSTDHTLSTNNPQDVDISKIESRKPTLKEFFFGFDED